MDEAQAHRHFSATCFNRTWDLLEKPGRTPAETEEMVEMAHASLWHWLRREDATATNRSVGYWQVSRVCAVTGDAAAARRYGERALAAATTGACGPFYLGYAHEALARAAALAGEVPEARAHLEQARAAAAEIGEPTERDALLADLGTIEAGD